MGCTNNHDRLIRLFANLFLVLFVADAAVSFVQELASLVSTLPALAALRTLVADIAILLAIPLYFLLGIDQRLPKRVFLPLVMFVLLCPLAAVFFPSLAGNRSWGLGISALQVLFCLLPLHLSGRGKERSLLLSPACFAGPSFNLKKTLAFGAVNLILIPFLMALTLASVANAWMEEHTAGFMRIAPDGLRMRERTYRRGNRTIRLAGMIHVGEAQYYDQLGRSLSSGRTLVLAEGVTDDERLLRSRLDYGRVAGFLGLTSQKRLRFTGREIGGEQLDEVPEIERREGKGERLPDILRADVDISSFRPQTIDFLNALGTSLQGQDSFLKGFASFNRWAEKNVTAETNDIIMDDILHRRNREVIRHLTKGLTRYDVVVIPWGALHMAEIEDEVLGQGFKLESERERVSIDFRRIIAGAW